MAGYSGTPLPKKLGIRDGSRVGLVFAPSTTVPAGFPIGASGGAPFDVVVGFVTVADEFRSLIERWAELITVDGGLWIAWPKKTARKSVPSDMTEDVVREVVLPRGLVDNKVCAIDDVWSGLRVVWRVEERAKRR